MRRRSSMMRAGQRLDARVRVPRRQLDQRAQVGGTHCSRASPRPRSSSKACADQSSAAAVSPRFFAFTASWTSGSRRMAFRQICLEQGLASSSAPASEHPRGGGDHGPALVAVADPSRSKRAASSPSVRRPAFLGVDLHARHQRGQAVGARQRVASPAARRAPRRRPRPAGALGRIGGASAATISWDCRSARRHGGAPERHRPAARPRWSCAAASATTHAFGGQCLQAQTHRRVG